MLHHQTLARLLKQASNGILALAMHWFTPWKALLIQLEVHWFLKSWFTLIHSLRSLLIHSDSPLFEWKLPIFFTEAFLFSVSVMHVNKKKENRVLHWFSTDSLCCLILHWFTDSGCLLTPLIHWFWMPPSCLLILDSRWCKTRFLCCLILLGGWCKESVTTLTTASSTHLVSSSR